MSDATTGQREALAGAGVAGIVRPASSPTGPRDSTALLPSLLTATLGAPAAALGLIEGIADGLARAARLAGGHRRRPPAPPRSGGRWLHHHRRLSKSSWLNQLPSGRSPALAPGPAQRRERQGRASSDFIRADGSSLKPLV